MAGILYLRGVIASAVEELPLGFWIFYTWARLLPSSLYLHQCSFFLTVE